jgi:hypothetical protein
MGLVRIQLHHEHHYERLHSAMLAKRFSQTIPSDAGQRYKLPRGTYWLEANLDVSALLDLAEQAVRNAGAHPPAMLIATVGSTAWIGLPRE